MCVCLCKWERERDSVIEHVFYLCVCVCVCVKERGIVSLVQAEPFSWEYQSECVSLVNTRLFHAVSTSVWRTRADIDGEKNRETKKRDIEKTHSCIKSRISEKHRYLKQRWINRQKTKINTEKQLRTEVRSRNKYWCHKNIVKGKKNWSKIDAFRGNA